MQSLCTLDGNIRVPTLHDTMCSPDCAIYHYVHWMMTGGCCYGLEATLLFCAPLFCTACEQSLFKFFLGLCIVQFCDVIYSCVKKKNNSTVYIWLQGLFYATFVLGSCPFLLSITALGYPLFRFWLSMNRNIYPIYGHINKPLVWSCFRSCSMIWFH